MIGAGIRRAHIRLVAASQRSVLAALVVMATGCAPDSLNNRQATGFNGYLNTLAASCRPLIIGSSDVGDWLMNRGGSSDPNYPYFIDMTSRLYYGTVSKDAYRDGLNGFLGPGTTNAQAFACIFANLPGQQTTGGAGM
jgi:hypothetical protein